MQSISQEKTDNFVLLNRVQFCNFFSRVNIEFFPICNKDVKKLWLPFVQKHLTKEEVRKDIRRMLSIKTNRVSNLTWTEKGQINKTQTRLMERGFQRPDMTQRDLPHHQQKKTSRTRSRNIRGGPCQQQQPFSTHPAGTTPATLFSSPVWKGAACVFRECATSLHRVSSSLSLCDKCNPTLCKRCKGPINILPTTTTSPT